MSITQSRFTFTMFYKYLNYFLVVLFTFFAILMPADNLNIKIFIFGILLVLNIKTIIMFFLSKEHIYYVFLTLLFPLCLFLFSITRVAFSDALAGVYVFSYMWLLPIILKYKINYLKYILDCLFLLSLIICLSALLDKTGVMSINSNPLLVYLDTAEEAQISKSVNAIFTYVIFLNASPLILILLLYSLFSEKWVWSFVAFSALLLSGTRANIYEALVLTAIYLIFFAKNKIVRTISLVLTIFIIYRYHSAFLIRMENMNTAKIIGDTIRASNQQSILQEINKNPISYLFGNGIGSQYYSPARLGLVSTSELSYLEFVRQNGVVGLSIFFIFLFRPVLTLFRNKKIRWICFAYIGYLVIAYTDPFLFTATGFVIYLLVYSLYEQSRYNELQKI